MKTIKILFVTLILMCLISCKKSSEPTAITYPPELDQVITSLTKSFDSLNTDMGSNAVSVSQNINDTAAIRSLMLGLFNRSSFVLEFSYVTPQGIMQIVEPSVYHSAEGSDISQQDHIIKTFQTKLPVLSKTFDAVEGFNAAVDVHPVLDKTQVLGAITALFLPQTILGRIITPVVHNQSFEIWAMEPGGKVLYDQDAYEIGRNVITDTLYAKFPELIAAAKLIDAQKSGETTYSFYQTDTTIKVVKKTYWKTYALYGTDWKIVWVKPI